MTDKITDLAKQFSAVVDSGSHKNEPCFIFDAVQLQAFTAALTAAQPTALPPAEHDDDKAVDRFAARMKWKLAQKRDEGKSGWRDRSWTPEQISQALREHVDKGDPTDVANYCMFLAARGEPITQPAAQEPLDMVLHCPKCGKQHVDAPEPSMDAHDAAMYGGDWPGRWTNPPHRSHLCQVCGHVWRPSDVATNGVASIKTTGKNDSPALTAAQPAEGEAKDASDTTRIKYQLEALVDIWFDYRRNIEEERTYTPQALEQQFDAAEKVLDEITGKGSQPAALPAGCSVSEWRAAVNTMHNIGRTASAAQGIPNHVLQAMKNILMAAQPAAQEPAPTLPEIVPLSDDECDALVAKTMDAVAKARNMHALDLNPDIQAHATLRRAIVRAAHGIGTQGAHE